MRRAAILAILAVLVGVGAWLYQTGRLSLGAAQPAVSQERPPVPVHVARAEQRTLPVLVTAIGHVAPFNTVQIKSRVDGQIDKVFYREGQDVREGEPLIEIDPRQYRAIVQQAEGQLARDEAQLNVARADLARSSALVTKGFTSRQVFDQQTSSVAQYGGAVAADQATLDNAKLSLSFTTIKAPIAGRIGRRLVDAGNIIHSSDNAVLAEIVQLHPIAVMLTVPQADLVVIREREKRGPVVIHALSVEDGRILADGTLAVIGNEIDQQTGTIDIKASFANTEDALWPGQFVNVQVETGRLTDVVSVPAAAVQAGSDGKFAYVVGADGKVRAVNVVLDGGVTGGVAAIKRGLAAGDRVVIDNQDQLAPGGAVKVLSAAESISGIRSS